MCGISGIAGMHDSAGAAEIVARMSKALAHRGPDDAGIYTAPGIAFGHRRLSIIDLSKSGHQPMTGADGRYTIVYNGELYNYKELKLELQRAATGSADMPVAFTTQTDTEVVLAAYSRWGADCLNRFNGMFAFAVWDNRERQLFIARDRLGIKPLYYWRNGSLFAFASEIRALLESGLIPRKPNPAALSDYLAFQTVHAPLTIIDNVNMLLPGHYILVQGNDLAAQAEPVKYWSPLAVEAAKPVKSYAEVCADVRNLLCSAVEKRLVSDVPFGAFLSGGMDSGIVVAVMAQVMNRKVQTFTVTFNEGGFNEGPYSRLVAEKYGTLHHEIALTAQDCLNKLPAALAAMDHPGGDGINSYIVSEATKQAGVTMALSGLGGDELFAGYPLFKRLYRLEKLAPFAPGLKPLLAIPAYLYHLLNRSPASAKIEQLCRLPDWNLDHTYFLSRQVFSAADSLSMLTFKTPSGRSAEYNSGQGILSRITTAELNHYLADVLLRDTDQMSMAHALEVRVPFLDHRLVEYVIALPDGVKYPRTPKKLLADALGDLLPPQTINRRKMGFTLPWNRWMSNELRSFCADNIKRLAARDSFNGDKILVLWNNFLKEDKGTLWYKIWHLVVLESWLEKNNVEC